MKKLIVLISFISSYSFCGFSQNNYSDADIIKLSNYIKALETKDSIYKLLEGKYKELSSDSTAIKLKAKYEELQLKCNQLKPVSNAIVAKDSSYDKLKAKYADLENEYKQLKATGTGVQNANSKRSAVNHSGEKINSIGFEINSSVLNAKSIELLNTVVSTFEKSGKSKLIIEGYTDDSGSDSHNFNLSNDRVVSVKRYLISKGISGSKISATGHGKENPIDSNETETGRANNRRVEIYILK